MITIDLALIKFAFLYYVIPGQFVLAAFLIYTLRNMPMNYVFKPWVKFVIVPLTLIPLVLKIAIDKLSELTFNFLTEEKSV